METCRCPRRTRSPGGSALQADERPHPRLLYALLEAGELYVSDLAATTGTSESTVSQALRMLRASGIVTGRRDGRKIWYRLSDEHVRELLNVTLEHTHHHPGDEDPA